VSGGSAVSKQHRLCIEDDYQRRSMNHPPGNHPADPAGHGGRTARAAVLISGATLLSRLLGFGRDAAVAWLLGAGMAADAFLVAFRLPNLLRRLLGEGALTVAYVPAYARLRSDSGEDEARAFAAAAFKVGLVAFSLAAVAAGTGAPLIVRLLAPGFGMAPDKLRLAIDLLRWMSPYIACVGAAALMMGTLNAGGHFTMPALASVAVNLAVIAAAVLLSPALAVPALGLAWGVVIGGMIQVGIQTPPLAAAGIRLLSGRWWHPMLRTLGRRSAPAVMAASVFQINSLVCAFWASWLSDGAVTCLYLAERLVQFPLGLIAFAAATAALPRFSALAAAGEMAALGTAFGAALRSVLLLILPAMAGLAVLRVPVVHLLFVRGGFDAASADLTAAALLFYSLGLWAFGTVPLVSGLFFAVGDLKTVTHAAAVCVAANALLGAVLFRWAGIAGLAAAASAASVLQLVLLLRRCRQRFETIPWARLAGSGAGSAAGALIMGWLVALAAARTLTDPRLSQAALAMRTAICIAGGAGGYALFALVFKRREMRELGGWIRPNGSRVK